MPDMYRSLSLVPRGVANRRAAIQWIRANAQRPGVLYFGDDDNTFDLKLFDEIRDTRKVSMFPVGLVGLYAVSSPIVEKVMPWEIYNEALNIDTQFLIGESNWVLRLLGCPATMARRYGRFRR